MQVLMVRLQHHACSIPANPKPKGCRKRCWVSEIGCPSRAGGTKPLAIPRGLKSWGLGFTLREVLDLRTCSRWHSLKFQHCLTGRGISAVGATSGQTTGKNSPASCPFSQALMAELTLMTFGRKLLLRHQRRGRGPEVDRQ